MHAHNLVNNTQYNAVLFAQWGYTALLRAAYNGQAEVVQMLLDCGSTLDEVTNVSVHPAPMSELNGVNNASTAVEATDVSSLH